LNHLSGHLCEDVLNRSCDGRIELDGTLSGQPQLLSCVVTGGNVVGLAVHKRLAVLGNRPKRLLPMSGVPRQREARTLQIGALICREGRSFLPDELAAGRHFKHLGIVHCCYCHKPKSSFFGPKLNVRHRLLYHEKEGM